MGEKQKEKKAKQSFIQKINPVPSVLQLLRDEKFRRIVGLLLILFSFYLLIAFVSFLFTWQTDQDLMYGSWKELLLDPEVEVSNWLGKIGAITSQIFINDWFGLASILFVFLFFLYGVKILANISLLPLAKTTKNTLFLMVWISAVIAYFIDTNYLFAGGATGYYMNEWLVLTLGKIGAILFLGFVLFVYLIIAYNFSFKVAARTISKAILWLLPKPKTKEILVDESNVSMGFSNIDPSKIEENAKEVDIFYPPDEKIAEPAGAEQSNELSLETELESALDMVDEDDSTIVDDELELDIPEANSEPVVEKVKKDSLDLDVEVAESKEETLSDKEVNQKLKDFGEYDPTLDLAKFKMPTLDMLEAHGDGEIQVDREELEANKVRIVETLRNYKIEIDKIKATIGPTVTLYEIVPAAGVRISKIKNLEDDIALSLSALGIRIIAPIPGRGTIGIEVPNQNPGIVSMRAAIASDRFQNSDMELPLALGKTISNETFVTDLAKMPHLLMAGATGQGKSVGLNAILVSILYKKHPSQVKFVLVDPKKVELTLFNKIERHYLAKLPDTDEAIITDTSKVVATLNSLCIEMDDRYDLLKDAHCRNIKEYNKKFINRKLNPENGHKYMPYIIVVVDEFADLIMTAGKEVETPIARIAQLARAIGIHLIIATQRPSVNIITGVIKANFPSRIAFRVSSKIDSRTILDAGGADQLIGRGDLLFSNGNDLIRVQCAFVDTPEVEAITDFIGNQQGYPDAFLLPEFVGDSEGGSGSMEDMERDALFEDAARCVVQNQQGSASLLQRRLKLGYNRAGRIIDQLEAAGIIGPFKGSKAREVIIPDEISLEQFLNNPDN